MFKDHSQVHSTTRVRTSLMLLAFAFITGMQLVNLVLPSRASAFTVTPSGCPGTIQAPKINGFGDFMMVEFPQRFAWRSPCYSTSKQVITVKYRLWGLNLQSGQWVKQGEQSRSGAAEANAQGAWIANWAPGAFYRYVSGDITVEWRTATGVLIGTKYIDYNGAADYVCISGPCFVFAGDPTVGAGLSLGYPA